MVNLNKGITLAKNAPETEFFVVRPDGTVAQCPGLFAELSGNDLQTLASLWTFARITDYHYFVAR
jgi:hypothetical protein